MKGGRNSRVFRVDCTDGEAVAVKAYFRSAQDRRDRMGCEFRALQLLEKEGLRKVASPLAADEERHVAVYEFIDGQQYIPKEISPAEIDQVVDFLRSLKEIADSGAATHFPAASEACFSIDAIFENLDRRVRRLEQAATSDPTLAQFLQEEFIPFRETAEEWCRDFCRHHASTPGTKSP